MLTINEQKYLKLQAEMMPRRPWAFTVCEENCPTCDMKTLWQKSSTTRGEVASFGIGCNKHNFDNCSINVLNNGIWKTYPI